MTSTGFWIDLMGQTLRDPRTAAQRLIAANPPMEARWLGLVLIAVLSLMATTLLVASTPAGNLMPWEGFIASPWTGLPAQVLGGIVMAFGLHRIGAFFGGTGRFPDALLCIVWVNAVQVAFMAAQVVATLLSTLLGGLVALASFVAFFWILTRFTCVLHGFQNAWKVFFGILASIALFIILLSTVTGLVSVLFVGFGA